ncbi:hypothetical protein [Sphingomonas folli]|nr:hypothetical protein [Sphingomonas folli]
MRHDDNGDQTFGKSGVKIRGGLIYLAFLLASSIGILFYAGDVI